MGKIDKVLALSSCSLVIIQQAEGRMKFINNLTIMIILLLSLHLYGLEGIVRNGLAEGWVRVIDVN
jgi:hypothetical protein